MAQVRWIAIPLTALIEVAGHGGCPGQTDLSMPTPAAALATYQTYADLSPISRVIRPFWQTFLAPNVKEAIS